MNSAIFTDSTAIPTIHNDAKRTIKDSVFRNLFSQKEYLLQLYQALHPEDKNATKADLEYVTLQNIMINADYNDLGFLIGNRLMILAEAQSTWCVNIIVRCVMYLAQTWKDYFIRTKQSVYSTTALNFPEPELYVIYTGNEVIEKKVLRFSEEFFNGEGCAIDVKVKIIYDGKDNDIISQYVAFTKVYDEQVKLYGRTREAVTNTINICKDRDVLKEYLESREKEVVDMMMTLFDEEQVMRAYVESEKKEAAVISAIEMCQEIGLPISETIKKIAGKYKLEENDAETRVQKYWK